MDTDKAKNRIVWWLKNEYIEFDEAECQIESIEKIQSKYSIRYKVKMITNCNGSEWVEANITEDGSLDKYQLFRMGSDGKPEGLIYCPRPVSRIEELQECYYDWENRTWNFYNYGT